MVLEIDFTDDIDELEVEDLTVSDDLVVTDDATIGGDLVVTTGDIDLVHVDKKLLLPIKNDATAPTLSFGDGDTGLYEETDDTIAIAINGNHRWEITTSYLGRVDSGYPVLKNSATTATSPTLIPNAGDTNSGIGQNAIDQVSIIAGGVEGHRITEAAGAITHDLTGNVNVDTTGVTRINIDSDGNNSGFKLMESNVDKYSIASYDGGKFSIWDEVNSLARFYISPTGDMVFTGNIDTTGIVQGDLLNNYMVQKATFDVLGLMTDPRFLNLMCEDPGAGTMTDVSGQGHDGTYGGTMTSADRIKKNMGWVLDLDGINDYISIPDHNDFSFGDSSNDEAVTWFGVIEVVDTAVSQLLASKYDDTGVREWYLSLDSSEKLKLRIYDEDANVFCDRLADTGLSVGWHSFVITYDGAGGATAGDTITIYIDGTAVASTASNNASYVSMVNTARAVHIGQYSALSNNFNYQGNIGCFGIDGSEWTAFTVHRFHQLMKGIYGL